MPELYVIICPFSLVNISYKVTVENPAIQRCMFAKDFFKKLTKGQIILFEMFCYEGFTVDEIQELLEIDKVFITSELSALKDIVLGNVNGNQEIELVSQEDNNLQEEEDSEDIAAIKAAVAAIVSDTEDEVKSETEGYRDTVSLSLFSLDFSNEFTLSLSLSLTDKSFLSILSLSLSNELRALS